MKQRFRKTIWQVFPGCLSAVAIALLLKLNAFETLEQITYHYLFQTRGSLAWDNRIVLIKIDDVSLQQLGRFPWSRHYYTRLLNFLATTEPSVVVMDLLLSESSPQDTQLAQAMMRQGHVILAQGWDQTGTPMQPVPPLEAAAITTGHVLKRLDSDGYVRKIDLEIQGHPALGVAATQTYSLVSQSVSLPDFKRPFWINWVSPDEQLHSYSFVDVIEGKVPAHIFQNKIVLVGVTGAGLAPLVTPFDQNPPTSSIYLHAHMIDNLLQQNALQPIWGKPFWVFLLLSAPGLSWLLSSWNTRQKLLGITGLCCSWGLLSAVAFRMHSLVPIAPPIALFIFTGAGVALRDRLQEDYLLRRQIGYLWEHYQQDLLNDVPDHQLDPLPGFDQTLHQSQESVLRVAQLAALADQLGRSQAAQSAIARSLPIGLLAADIDGTVWFCNPVAMELLGITMGSNLIHGVVPNWISVEQWQTSLTALQAGNFIKHHYQCQSRTQTGSTSEQWFDIWIQPLNYRIPRKHKQSNQYDGLLLLLENITEHKHIEAELQQAKELALREAERSAAANRAKSEFLANMSHELRTPLNVILGFTQVISHDTTLNPEHQEHLNSIKRSGQHLLGLINDVLEMSKIEAGRTQLNETSFNLHHLLDDLEKMLQVRVNAKQLVLSFERNPQVPQYIIADEGKLCQVLLNLLGNAIKFTAKGRVTLRVKLEADQPTKHEPESIDRDSRPHGLNQLATASSSLPIVLAFEVEDTGTGIAPEELQQLFQPFTQAHAGQKAGEGTGLGLTISQKFVHLMGGNISVYSAISQGSTFKFHIRARQVQSADMPPRLKTERVIGLALNQPTYRILIVEDHWENSQFLVKLLTPLGFELRQAQNGAEGIELWQQWQPDLILMDIRMPILDGVETTQTIRVLEQQQGRFEKKILGNDESLRLHEPASSDRLPPTKIIMLTASVFGETQKTMAEIGCDDFLYKPIQANTLFAKLVEHLGVEFLYDPSADQAFTLTESRPPATVADLQLDLAQMPLSWVEQLHQMAIKGSDELILQLIEQIPPEQSALAQGLKAWASCFRFDDILELTQSRLSESSDGQS